MVNKDRILNYYPVRKIKLNGKDNWDRESITDLRFKKSGFKKCIQCGRCTGSCPSTVIYRDFNPRDMMRRFMFDDLHSDYINDIVWKCGQCYSCRARCPRNCKAGLGLVSLQNKSYNEGRAPKKIVEMAEKITENLYTRGETFTPASYQMNLKEEFGSNTAIRCSANHIKREKLGFKKDDARDIPIPEDAINEIKLILKLTGFKEIKNETGRNPSFR